MAPLAEWISLCVGIPERSGGRPAAAAEDGLNFTLLAKSNEDSLLTGIRT